jgi:hypothetical protein
MNYATSCTTDIVEKHKARLDSIIVYDRDYTYDYFGFKVRFMFYVFCFMFMFNVSPSPHLPLSSLVTASLSLRHRPLTSSRTFCTCFRSSYSPKHLCYH